MLFVYSILNATNHTIVYWLTEPKMHLITTYQDLKQTWNDMTNSYISQIKCNSMNVFLYLFIQLRNALTVPATLKVSNYISVRLT